MPIDLRNLLPPPPSATGISHGFALAFAANSGIKTIVQDSN